MKNTFIFLLSLFGANSSNAVEQTLRLDVKKYARSGNNVTLFYEMKVSNKSVTILASFSAAFICKKNGVFINSVDSKIVNAGGPGSNTVEGKRVNVDAGKSYTGEITVVIPGSVDLAGASIIYSFGDVVSNEAAFPNGNE